MAGRKPDYRVIVPQDNGRGRTNYFRIASGWRNEEGGSIGVQVNVGLPVVLNPGQKLVLFENTEKEEDAEFEPGN
jgi:hypothetical protein